MGLCLTNCDVLVFDHVATTTGVYVVRYQINGWERQISVPAVAGQPVALDMSILNVHGCFTVYLYDTDGTTFIEEKNITILFVS